MNFLVNLREECFGVLTFSVLLFNLLGFLFCDCDDVFFFFGKTFWLVLGTVHVRHYYDMFRVVILAFLVTKRQSFRNFQMLRIGIVRDES